MSCPETIRIFRAARRTEALAEVVFERIERMTAEQAARPGSDTSGLEYLALLAEAVRDAAAATVIEAMDIDNTAATVAEAERSPA